MRLLGLEGVLKLYLACHKRAVLLLVTPILGLQCGYAHLQVIKAIREFFDSLIGVTCWLVDGIPLADFIFPKHLEGGGEHYNL